MNFKFGENEQKVIDFIREFGVNEVAPLAAEIDGQKQKYLIPLLKGEKLGAFAVTDKSKRGYLRLYHRKRLQNGSYDIRQRAYPHGWV